MKKTMFILILGGSIFMSACQLTFFEPGPSPIPTPGADEVLLPFTLLYDDQGGGSYSIHQPELIMINSISEISQTERIVLHISAHEKIKAVDFEQYFVLVVFQGCKLSGGYKVIVKQVTKRNKACLFMLNYGTLITRGLLQL